MATVAFVNTNGMTRTGVGSPVTDATFTVSATTDCAVLQMVLRQTGSAVTPTASATWNSVSFTAVSTPAWDSTNGCLIGNFTLVAPAIGTLSLVMTFAPGAGGTITDLYYGLTNYVNVDQGTPVRASSWTTALNQTADGSKHVFITIPNTVSGDMATDTWVAVPPQNNTGVGTSWTPRNNSGAGNFNSVSSADISANASSMQDTITETTASIPPTVVAGFALQQATSGTPTTIAGLGRRMQGVIYAQG